MRRVWFLRFVALGVAVVASRAASATETDPPSLVHAPGSPVGVGAGALAAGDVNGDGFGDVLLIVGTRLDVYFGAANRIWRKEADASVDLAADVSEMVLADLDRDGKQDLVLADHDSYDVAVWLGRGDGGFNPVDGSPFAACEGERPHTHGLVVADVNGDGHLDIVTANNEDGDVSLLVGDGSGSFLRALGSPFPCGPSPYPIAAADVNGDGRADVLVPNAVHDDPQKKSLVVLLGGRDDDLTPAPASPLIGDAALWYAAAGDLTGDGWADVVATHSEGASGATVWINAGDGQFLPAPDSPLEFGHGAWSVQIVDMNGDGRADLVVAADTSIRVLHGDGSGRFTPAPGSPFKTGKGAWRAVVADFNGDGPPDVAVRCVEANQLEVFLGQ